MWAMCGGCTRWYFLEPDQPKECPACLSNEVNVWWANNAGLTPGVGTAQRG